MNIAQLAAIARYEFLMAVRRRSLIILLVLFVLGILVFSLIAKETNASSALRIKEVDGRVEYFQGDTPVPPEAIPAWMQGVDLAQWQGSSQVMIALLGSVVLVSIAIVMFMNESIPLDRQHRIRELLDALPLSRATYLGGKLVGAWFGVLVITFLSMLVSVGVFLAIFNAFNITYFVMVWLLMIVPVIAINTSLAVLLTSWAGSRRSAILISLLVTPLALLVYSVALPSLGAVGVYVHPSYAMMVLLQPDASSVNIVTERIRSALPLLISMPIISWLVAYGWQRFREAR